MTVPMASNIATTLCCLGATTRVGASTLRVLRSRTADWSATHSSSFVADITGAPHRLQ